MQELNRLRKDYEVRGFLAGATNTTELSFISRIDSAVGGCWLPALPSRLRTFFSL